MATRFLLPVVTARSKEEQSIQATVIFCNNPADGATKVCPIHLFDSAEAEVILGLVDGVVGAHSALERLRAGSPKGVRVIREAFCTAALGRTHSNESLLNSPISDPLDLILDIYGPVGQGVYVFDGFGRLAIRRSSLSDYDRAPVGDTEFLTIRTNAGLEDRFLSVREDACRIEVEALSAGRRVAAALRERLLSVLVDLHTLSSSSLWFPSAEVLARLESQIRRPLERLDHSAEAVSMVGDMRVAGSAGAVSVEW